MLVKCIYTNEMRSISKVLRALHCERQLLHMKGISLMTQWLSVVKKWMYNFVCCTKSIEHVIKCLKKLTIWWSALSFVLTVLKFYHILVKIVPKRTKKTVKNIWNFKQTEKHLWCYCLLGKNLFCFILIGAFASHKVWLLHS